MALQADLKTMNLEDLLQWLYQSESTGRIQFRHPSGDLYWHICGGRLVHVEAPAIDVWAAARFGDENWRKAKTWAARERTTPPEILARVGLLDAGDSTQWLSEAGKRALHQMFLWDDGWFLFEEDAIEGEGVPVEHLLLDVAREVDERRNLKDRFGDRLVWVEAVPGAVLDGLDEALRALLIDGVHLVELAWLLSDDPWDATKAILEQVEAKQVMAVPVPMDVPGDPIRAYQDAVIRERSFRYEEAAALFEEAITGAWGDTFAREAVQRWSERYRHLLHTHLVAADRLLRTAADARPEPGDPYAAFLVRRLNEPQSLAQVVDRSPFQEFFALRSVRRLAAGGQLSVTPGAKGGHAS